MKRIVSVLLIGVFVLTGFFQAELLAASGQTQEFITGFLYRLGCIDTDTGADEEISLDEFLHNVQKLTGSDAPARTASEGKMALMQGVCALVDALGYRIALYAQTDAAYLAKAEQIGLLRGITAAPNDIITKAAAHWLLFNALTAKQFTQTSYGQAADYEVTDRTFLRDVFRIGIVKGVVSAFDSRRVRVDTNAYGPIALVTGKSDLCNALGMEVSVYVRLTEPITGEITADDLNNREIFEYRRMANEVLKIKRSDLTSYDPAAGRVEYIDSGNRRLFLSTADDLKIIYNGQPAGGATVKGSIAGYTDFIDNDSDGLYDYAVIWDFHELYVDAAYPESKTYRSKFSLSGSLAELASGKNLKINPDQYSLVIEKDGKRADIKDIQKSDVLNIAVSGDKSFVKIIIYRIKAEGAISAMSLVRLSDTELNISDSQITVADKSYKLSKDFYNGVKSAGGGLPFKMGNSGKFYINFEGKIAYADVNASFDNYGYLIDASAGLSLREATQIRLVNGEGDAKAYKLAETTSVNGSRIKEAKLGAEGYAGLFIRSGSTLSAVPQLVQYKLNENDEVSSIKLAAAGYDTARFSLNHDYASPARKYLSKGDQLGQAYVSADTVVFVYDDSKPATDKDAYSVTDKGYFTDKVSYRALVYDKDKDFNAAAVVVYGEKAVLNPQAKLSIVTMSASALTAKGEQKTRISFMENGAEKALFVSDSLGAGLKKGVVFQYALKNAEEIALLDTVADLNHMPGYYVEGDMEVSDKLLVAYGAANVRSETIGVKTGGGEMRYKVSGDTSVYQYEKSSGKTKVIDLSAIENDSAVLVKVTANKVTDVIKIK